MIIAITNAVTDIINEDNEIIIVKFCPVPLTCFHCIIFTVQKYSPSESAASRFLFGFWKFCIFVRKISRRVIHACQFAFLITVNDKDVIFEKCYEKMTKMTKNDSLSLTVFFLSNFTATYLADIASGQFSDRKIFGSPVIVRIWSLLSVINIDRLFVCLFVT